MPDLALTLAGNYRTVRLLPEDMQTIIDLLNENAARLRNGEITGTPYDPEEEAEYQTQLALSLHRQM